MDKSKFKTVKLTQGVQNFSHFWMIPLCQFCAMTESTKHKMQNISKVSHAI